MSVGSERAGSSPAETFGGWLSTRSDEQLVRLLQARPDVSVPPPADFEVLARRLSSSASVGRALERVDRFGLEVLEVLALLGRSVAAAELADAAGIPLDALQREVEALEALGFLWGDELLTLPRGVGDELGPHPLGLGRSGAELVRTELAPEERELITANLGLDSGPIRGMYALLELFDDPGRVAELVDATDGPERQLLEQLATNSPVGSTGGPVRVPALAEAGTAVGRLLARGLLIPAGADLVELPREVALALRRPAARRSADGTDTLAELVRDRLHPDPPPLEGPVRTDRDVDGASATAGAELLRRLDALIERWEQAPPVLTRSGGLPVRELRATAKDFDLTTDEVAVLAELARTAELLAETAGMETSVVPTEYVDAWRTLSNAERWAVVAGAWLELEGWPGLTTSVQPRRPGADGDAVKPVPVFSWEVRRSGAAAGRREVLDILAGAPPGTAPSAASVLQRLGWQGPRRNSVWWDAAVTWTLSEAELLGITGRGALSSAGRALLADGTSAAAHILDRHLPPPVDHLLVQGDLTAIAPGPLEPVLAREVGLVADVESAGAATVFRFSESSVRRALDAGRSASDVHALLARTARGGVPQSLTYLVDDVARRHGRLRVGSISCYLRCDDPALLAEVVAARRKGSVDLRQVAPTVAVSSAPLDRVLEVLRAAGYAPASEGADGQLRIERREAERVPVPVRRTFAVSSGLPRDHLAATVVRLRRAETVARAARSGVRRSTSGGEAIRSPGAVLGRLHEVVDIGGAVQISYVNLEGRSSQRIVHPLLLSGGYLTAYDEESGERRTFAVSRISSLTVLAED